VATCSYEARRFSIHSAMTAARARSLGPPSGFRPPTHGHLPGGIQADHGNPG
jgi:nucleotidyltransferase/DNA polymerase involved in DNA repair